MALTSNYDLMEASRRNHIPLQGVFWNNELPERGLYKEGGYVVNLGNRVEGGSHWVAFWIEKEKNGKHQAVFFDPFGGSPPESVKRFLLPFGMVYWNDQQIQNIDTSICGYYILAFLYYMTRWRRCCPSLSKRMDVFVGLFDKDVEKNRTILMKLLKPLS